MSEGSTDVAQPKAAGLGDDPRDLVQPSLKFVSNWETNLGGRRTFRVRGLSWFRANVYREIDRLKPQIAAMEEERRKWPAWCTQDFDWEDKFSIQQVYQAAGDSNTALKFVKAAKVLLLCELAALKVGIASSITFSKMRIEPAIFGVSDLDEAELARAVETYPNLLGSLRDATGQATRNVFLSMAAGKAVSYRLAWKTREALIALTDAQRFQWGPIVIVTSRNGRPVEYSNEEVIDFDSVPAGAPNPFEPPGYILT